MKKEEKELEDEVGRLNGLVDVQGGQLAWILRDPRSLDGERGA